MIQPVIDKSYSFEINLTALNTGAQINFPVLQLLNGANVYGFQAFVSDDQSVSASGKTVVSLLGAANITVTLVVGQDEENFAMPYLDLRPASNGGLIRTFKEKLLNLTSCYITLNGVANLVAGQSVILQAIYNKRG